MASNTFSMVGDKFGISSLTWGGKANDLLVFMLDKLYLRALCCLFFTKNVMYD